MTDQAYSSRELVEALQGVTAAIMRLGAGDATIPGGRGVLEEISEFTGERLAAIEASIDSVAATLAETNRHLWRLADVTGQEPR